jgi:preprotein translocase subunit YajC
MSLILMQAGGSSPLIQFLPLILIFVIFYFLLFLPMQRQRKAEQKMRAELKPGDNVTTGSGLIGTVVGLHDDGTVTLRLKPDGVKLQMRRDAVSGLIKESN